MMTLLAFLEHACRSGVRRVAIVLSFSGAGSVSPNCAKSSQSSFFSKREGTAAHDICLKSKRASKISEKNASRQEEEEMLGSVSPHHIVSVRDNTQRFARYLASHSICSML